MMFAREVFKECPCGHLLIFHGHANRGVGRVFQVRQLLPRYSVTYCIFKDTLLFCSLAVETHSAGRLFWDWLENRVAKCAFSRGMHSFFVSTFCHIMQWEFITTSASTPTITYGGR